MFELFQLRCFVAVASELNFRRAAKSLNMTQPPLSRQIQLLEHEVGAKLLERTSRSVQLTAAGRLFLPEAIQLLDHAESAALTARRAQAGREGVVQFGFLAGSAFDFLPRILTRTNAKAPSISLVLREMKTVEQVAALMSGRIELGISRMPRELHQLNVACVSREPFTLALPADHPLAAKDDLKIQDLSGEAYIMFSPADGQYGYQIIGGLLSASGVTPDIVQHAAQTHTVMALINAGLGSALVPAFAKSLGFHNVVFRDLDLPPTIVAELYLIWREETMTPIAMTIRDIILDEARGRLAD